MADRLDGLIISEILADNAGNAAFDTDQDGTSNKADEFVEIQNATGSAISLDGYEIWSEKVGLLYQFGAGDSIAAGGTATVLGEYTGTPPAGFYDSGAADTVNWLPDGEGQKFDSIFLVNSVTGEYVVLSYGSPPRTPTLPSNFPGTTQIGAGEQIDSSAPNGIAFARDANGDFIETTPTPGTPGVPCFCPGTLIETVSGPVAVENLVPGTILKSRGNRRIRLLATRRFVVPQQRRMRDPEVWPILLPKGLFGLTRNLQVSPNHRLLFSATEASLLFGETDVLIAARHLIGHGAMRMPPRAGPLVYHHLLADHHAILRAHGIWTESLFLGDMMQNDAQLLYDWDVAPGVVLGDVAHKHAACLLLNGHEAQVLLSTLHRHPLRQAA